MKIRSSMYRMVFAMAGLPFLFFTFVIINIYSDRLENVVKDSLYVVANAQIEEMKNFCDQQRGYLKIIGTTDMARESLSGKLDRNMLDYFNEMLYTQVQSTGYLNSISLIDTNWRVAASSEEHALFASAELEPIIELLGTRDFFISNVLTNDNGDKTLVAVSSIRDGGEIIGYALAEISLDFYENMRERAELWSESTFYLLDGNQNIISAGTPDEQRDKFVTTEKERADYNKKLNAIDFDKNPKGSFQYKVGGKDYITYYSDVDYTDWRIMLSVDMEVYKAERTIYITLAVTLILMCIALALWIGWFASKRIVRPIQLITATLNDIQKSQDYTFRVAVGREDELGTLASEVNRLIEFIETEDLYKQQQQRLLQEKADLDALTRVLNKAKIRQHLEEAVLRCREQQTKLAVLFVDVDDFKAFNTNYGHSVGDQVLLFLASLLAGQTGGTVGRFGGDEFLVVVEGGENVDALDASLELIREMAASRFIIRGSGVSLPVTCCVGGVRVDFSSSQSSGLDVENLINEADSAMYKVKNNGKKGHIIYDL